MVDEREQLICRLESHYAMRGWKTTRRDDGRLDVDARDRNVWIGQAVIAEDLTDRDALAREFVETVRRSGDARVRLEVVVDPALGDAVNALLRSVQLEDRVTVYRDHGEARARVRVDPTVPATPRADVPIAMF